MSSMLRRRHGDDDDEVEAKRRRGPEIFADVERRLQDLIVRIGEKSATSSLESNLESLCAVLETDLDNFRTTIIDIIVACVLALPEKLTVYSTLVGLLNAKNFNFGGEIVEKLVGELQDKLETEDYRKALFVIIFLCDLGNCKVLTLTSISEFLESLVQVAYEENVPQVRTDWFVFAVLHALPWIAHDLNEKRPDELGNMLEGCEKYIEGRTKPYMPLLRVWAHSCPHEQEDYLDSLWAQISQLKENGWKEKHIQRHYVAFDAALQDALQHNLPSFTAPVHKDVSVYPTPFVVFRLFDYADCPESGPLLPGAHSIERFLIEEELTWIIEHHCFDRKACAEELLSYGKGANVPISYMVLEVIFSQLFRLPLNPQPAIFYGSLLIELCKVQPNAIPQVLAQAAELLYQRAEGMQPICIDRFIDWFSFHLSNFQYRWSWSDWNDCLKSESWNGKFIFAREVLEKCMRFSYYERICEAVPDDFSRILPPRPEIRYILDDETEPGHERAGVMMSLFQERASNDVMLAELKGKDGQFDPQEFAIFFAVLLKLAAKSFSHNLSALAKYQNTLKEVADVSEEMQSIILRTLYTCWKANHEVMIVLVDKLLKMQIIDCGVVVAWVFSDELKFEMDRQWLWEILNISLDRLTRHINKVDRDVAHLKQRVNRHKKENEDEEMADADHRTADEEQLDALQEKLDSLRDFQKNLFLDVLHKFTIVLTEHIVNCESDGTDFRNPWFEWMTGRFRHVFLMHHKELRRYSDDLGKELFSESTVDPHVLETYQQFVSLH